MRATSGTTAATVAVGAAAGAPDVGAAPVAGAGADGVLEVGLDADGVAAEDADEPVAVACDCAPAGGAGASSGVEALVDSTGAAVAPVVASAGCPAAACASAVPATSASAAAGTWLRTSTKPSAAVAARAAMPFLLGKRILPSPSHGKL